VFFIGISGSVSFISFIKRFNQAAAGVYSGRVLCFYLFYPLYILLLYILLYMRAKDNLFYICAFTRRTEKE